MVTVEERGAPIPPDVPGIARIRSLLGAGADDPLRLWIWPNFEEGRDGSVVFLGVVSDGRHPVTISSPSWAVILHIDDGVLTDPEKTESDFWAEVVRSVDDCLEFEGPPAFEPPPAPRPLPARTGEE